MTRKRQLAQAARQDNGRVRAADHSVRTSHPLVPATIETPTWPTLGISALPGLASDFVRIVEPHTEADPAALLVQFLVAFGSVAGRNSYFAVEADRHYPNLYCVLVGESSKGRKGTSLGQVKRVFGFVENDSVLNWLANNQFGGLSSGEGLIWAVRDPALKIKTLGDGTEKTVTEDEGVADKRLLITEGEFAAVLKSAAREGNTLSAILRNAWDSGNLRSLVKNNPTRATDAHVSLVGHITAQELRRYLSETESGNGFANRFLWVGVKRSKCLPDGGNLQTCDLEPIAHRLARAVRFAQQEQRCVWDDEARAQWHVVYPALSEGRPGLWGAVTGRAEAQVTRLAMIHALLDESRVISRPHLEAALSVWRYCDETARYVFGGSLGDPAADELRAALRAKGKLTRTDVSSLFNNNIPAKRIDDAVRLLVGIGEVEVVEDRSSPGRPKTWVVWTATKETK